MFRIGLENNTEGRSLAWVLDHPGCFVYGVDGLSAMNAVPQTIRAYRDWIAAHTTSSWLEGNEIDYFLDETWECYTIDEKYELAREGYEVNAWFRYDWLPLSAAEIDRGLQVLAWVRIDLLNTVNELSPEVLARTYPGERWSIAGIVGHIAGGEWWYLDRFGQAFPQTEIPDNPFESLEFARAKLVSVLPTLAGSSQVLGLEGEIWSPRKLLRRAVWHEADHVAHIRKLL